MRLRIITAVWGADFVERFLDLTLRSLSAPGNLPDLARHHEVSYHLYAPSEDIERIKAARILDELAKIVSFRFWPSPLSRIDAGNAMSHWKVWHAAISAAREENVYVILIAPDHLLCRGALIRWAELLEQGHLAVFSPGVQVVIETLAPEMAQRFAGGCPIDLSRPELIELMLRHLHPVKIGLIRGSPRSIGHPEWHLRALPGHGLVQRILASHPVAFHASRVKLAENFSPTEQFERVAFEPSWLLGGEPLLKQLGLYLRSRPFDDPMLSYYGVWAEKFIAPVHLNESKTTHVYTLGSSFPRQGEQRQRRGADFFVGQMHASRAIIRLWRTLREAGLEHAARWLAAAHLHARLRRRVPLKPPLTLLVPGDDVLSRLDADEARGLLANGGSALTAVLRAHAVPAHLDLRPGNRLTQSSGGPIATLAGRHLAPCRRGGVRIVRGPIHVDEVQIFVIDQPLASLTLRRGSAAGRLAPVVRTLARARRRAAESGKRMILATLGRDQRRLMLLLSIRDALRPRWGEGRRRAPKGPSRDGPGQARLEGGPAGPEALDLFRRAVAARGLDAVNELYAFYCARVLEGSSIASAPAARLAGVPPASAAQISMWLEDALARAPSFAEAWLELGYLRKEAGDESGALDAFERCQRATAAFGRRIGQPDPCALAAMESALLLAHRGEPESALAQLRAIVDPRWLPWTYHLVHAQSLVALGRPQEAVTAFERCLEWTSIESRLDVPLPSRIDGLEELLARQTPDSNPEPLRPMMQGNHDGVRAAS